MNLTSLRTGFTVRYSPVVEMGQIGRALATPHLEGGEVQIKNAGQGHEAVTLLFQDRRCMILYDWARMLFAVEGSREDVLDPSGPSKPAFEILQQILERGYLREVRVQTADVATDLPRDTEEAIEQYLSEGRQWPSMKDVLVRLEEVEHQPYLVNLDFGPYKGKPDYNRHVSIFSDRPAFSAYFDVTGLLIKAETIHSTRSFDLNTFKKMVNVGHEVAEQCL